MVARTTQRASRLTRLVASLACLGAFQMPAAAAPSPTEHDVQAAFLYNFTKFVEWPDAAFKKNQETLEVGVLGKDPFEGKLENEWAGKAIHDKKVIFKHISDPAEGRHCQLVFISASEKDRLDEVLSYYEKYPVLTVSDVGGFIQHGGMIGFVLDKNKVRFNINQTAAEKSGLKISSQLLKLAKVIVQSFGKVWVG